MKGGRLKLVAAAVIFAPVLWFLLFFYSADDVTLVRATRGDLAIGVEFTGRLEAVTTSLLGPPQVDNMYRFKVAMMADEGTEVEPDTPVLAFDPSELQQKLRTRMTEAEAARKEIEKLEVDLKVRRQDNLMSLAEAEAALRKATLKTATPSELVSTLEEAQARLDLELAELQVASLTRRLEATSVAGEAELEALRADLTKADADVRNMQEAISKMTRTAPRRGVVIHVRDWRGEKKKVGDTVWIRDHVVEIPDLSAMMATGDVEEALSGRVEVGQAIRLRLDAHPEVEYSGRVSSVSRAVQKRSWRNPLKIVNIEVSLDETDPERMRPGMRVRGTIETLRLENVLTVPLTAVFPSPSGPVAYRRGVFGLHATAVELGERNTERAEVLQGLEVGERISTTRPD